MAKILIVDDEAHIARVMRIWLERHGHDVSQASNGADAVEILKNESMHLVISDMNMPVLDGLGLTRRVRQELKCDVPIILVTARCDQAELKKELAPFDVKLYPKPFIPSRLVEDITDMLSAPASHGE